MPERPDPLTQTELVGWVPLGRSVAPDSGRFVSQTVRIASRDRMTAILGAAIALFLVAAIAKPWAGPDQVGRRGPRRPNGPGHPLG